MKFIDKLLQEPSYGWMDENGNAVQPSAKEIFKEMRSRVNVFKSRKNWISAIGWFWVLCMVPFFVAFVTQYLTWWTFLAFIVYAMIIMSTHATIWYHRYTTHKAFQFSNNFWKILTQNLVVKVIPEEIYAISHIVHHAKSDQPGDPYNARLGFLYCFFADTNHQGVSKDLNEEEYYRAAGLIKHSGIIQNTYEDYREWGSIADPFYTAGLWILNWSFWYATFFLIGGHALACALFSGAMFWVVGVRAFNYTGHGNGKEKHQDGIDFDRSNLSINQLRPGLFAGEWHNNHHLFPGSARAGFLPYQLDLAWIYIYTLYKIGGVSSYHDSKQQFYEQYMRKNIVKKPRVTVLAQKSTREVAA